MRQTITRRVFGAYDPEVWQIQTYLSELGFNPGPIDGLWGSKTTDAALTFRQWAGIGAASGLDKNSVVDDAFWTQIDRATASAGFDINIEAPLSAPGGAGVSPSVSSGGAAPAQVPSGIAPSPAASADSSSILPVAILALGAYVAFGGKKRR
jgi:peptidoglycan hydrolase-like protein with peptidoglycan-binding domain